MIIIKKEKKEKQQPKVLGAKYVPEYAKNYFDLPWYEEDLMHYYDYLDYKDMADNPNHHFKNKKVINIDIIIHECRGDPPKKFLKDHKTVTMDDFKKYPENEKNKVVPAVIRNNDRNDLWIKRDLMIEHFKKFFSA